ncbi:MAG: hypothetical protein KDD45_13430, partial [Bdellovibrionales bacterium]|nr:hypothetical protein [Bdellovibrionales bacterium]
AVVFTSHFPCAPYQILSHSEEIPDTNDQFIVATDIPFQELSNYFQFPKDKFNKIETKNLTLLLPTVSWNLHKANFKLFSVELVYSPYLIFNGCKNKFVGE